MYFLDTSQNGYLSCFTFTEVNSMFVLGGVRLEVDGGIVVEDGGRKRRSDFTPVLLQEG